MNQSLGEMISEAVACIFSSEAQENLVYNFGKGGSHE